MTTKVSALDRALGMFVGAAILSLGGLGLYILYAPLVTAQTATPEPPRWVFERPPAQDAIDRQYQEDQLPML